MGIDIIMVMNRVKFVLTFLVVVGTMLGGYFLVQQKPDASEVIKQKAAGNKLGFDSAVQSNEVGLEGGLTQGLGLAYAPADANGNVTKLVAQSMFLKMKQLDEGGTNPFNGLDVNNPKTRAMVEESISSVPESIFETKIDSKDLKISSDNSRNAKIEYLRGIARITKERLTGQDKFKVAKQELIDNLNSDCFGDGTAKNAELSNAYGVIFDDYKNLTVPSSWISVHKAILRHFKELGDLYGAFNKCKEDPIRAYVAMDRLPKVYAQTKSVQKMIDAKAAELGLK